MKFAWLSIFLSAAALSEPVITSEGPIEGVANISHTAYLGVPYAQPPIDDRTWRKPIPPTPRGELFVADSFSDRCMQRPNPDAKIAMSLDCLYLNIWVPKNNGESLPVAVWIHGGGFMGGSGSDSAHAAKQFVDNGIIFITLNYRLGPLGFMAHPDYSDEPANRGFADMAAALGWINNNISAFSGDVNNITLMGESAGGMAVQSLMTMPSTRGLFTRAIAQSGYAAWPLPSTNEARKKANAFIDASKDSSTPIETMIASVKGFHLPVIDKHTIAKQPVTAFVDQEAHPVAYMTGGNSMDGSVFPYSGISFEQFASLLGAEPTKKMIATHVANGSDNFEIAAAKLFGEARYLIASAITANAQMHRANTYRYYFDFVPQGLRPSWHGAPHATELPLIFNVESQVHTTEVLNHKVAAHMRQYWLNFIKTGTPNGPDLTTWPTAQNDVSWLHFHDDSVDLVNTPTPTLTLLQQLFMTMSYQ